MLHHFDCPAQCLLCPQPQSLIMSVCPDPWHLSVQKHGPKSRQRQARLHQLDDAAKPSGEPGGSASGDFPGLIGGTFFLFGVWVRKGSPLAVGTPTEGGRGMKRSKPFKAGRVG